MISHNRKGRQILEVPISWCRSCSVLFLESESESEIIAAGLWTDISVVLLKVPTLERISKVLLGGGISNVLFNIIPFHANVPFLYPWERKTPVVFFVFFSECWRETAWKGLKNHKFPVGIIHSVRTQIFQKTNISYPPRYAHVHVRVRG